VRNLDGEFLLIVTIFLKLETIILAITHQFRVFGAGSLKQCIGFTITLFSSTRKIPDRRQKNAPEHFLIRGVNVVVMRGAI